MSDNDWKLTWKRERPGVYTSGPYLVEQNSTGGWYASGPSVDSSWHLKTDAQVACLKAALKRIAGQEFTCAPVVGDVIEYPGRRAGRVSSIRVGARHLRAEDEPMYVVQFSHGKRLCLFRREFKVVVP